MTTQTTQAAMSVLAFFMCAASEHGLTLEKLENTSCDFEVLATGSPDFLQDLGSQLEDALTNGGWIQTAPEGWELKDTGISVRTSTYENENADQPDVWHMELSFYLDGTGS